MACHCDMCGAVEGRPHHDPAARGRTVTLHHSYVALEGHPAQLRMRQGRIVCQFCRDGIYAIRRAEQAEKAAAKKRAAAERRS